MAINSNEIDRLVAEGKYAEAARAAKEAGEAQRAGEIYERIWEFGEAARCAREAGDLPRALRNAIDARDEALLRAVGSELRASGDAGARAALEVFAQRHRFADAGRAAELVGERDRAIEYFKQAYLYLDASRLSEEAGRDREAGRLLERVIEHGDDPASVAQAELRLGLLLARRMQHEDAVRQLQAAARREATRDRAERALAIELTALGLRDAARDMLASARTRDPSLPADLDEFIAGERDRDDAPNASHAELAGGDAQLIAGRYRLEGFLGSGGSGRVFRARDEVTGRTVAVKLFNTAHTRGHQAYERFVREARVAGALRHPNLVEIYDFSAELGYTAMELMVGGSLAERIRPTMASPAIRRMCLDVLSGLALAHQRGIIHRDVKPANIFFDARGAAKLGDFGVAHLLDLGQTQTGGLIGTLAYMAPEQITGARLTIAADLYAIGVTLFEALTGRLPFMGPDFVAQHLGEHPPALTAVSAEVAPGWDPIVASLLNKDPDSRYESIDVLRRDIEAVDLGDASRPKPLVLPRPGAAVTAVEVASAEPVPTPPEAAPDQPAPSRYQFETPLGRTEISSLSRALDSVLDRSVIIERYHDGAIAEDVERRLYAHARGGGPFLQRALAFDHQAAVAVYEAPSGTPIGDVLADPDACLAPRHAARLLKRLARAVAQLHDHGHAHGSLRAANVLLDDAGNPTVLVCGLGPVVGKPAPREDVEALLRLIVEATSVKTPNVSTQTLVDSLVPNIPAAAREGILRLGRPKTGEELHALADAIEVAVLKSQGLRRPGRQDPVK